ncbi:MAG: ribosome silencing factor [Salinivirgaceae bacterium]
MKQKLTMTETTETTNLKNTVVEAIKEKKGKEIIVLGLTELQQSVADFFVICHGDSNTQVDAIASNIERQARTELKEHVIHKEGTENSQWVLLDYGDVVVHVFQEPFRKFYNLEDLWADANTELIKED